MDSMLADLAAALTGTPPDELPSPSSGTSPGVADPGVVGVAALWGLLNPPPALRERMLLFASDGIRAAFEAYKGSQASQIAAGGDADAWVDALEDCRGAYDRLRTSILSEVRAMTSDASGHNAQAR
jgi:hypothetical protein